MDLSRNRPMNFARRYNVVRLTTTLELPPDHQALNGEGVVRTVYDCAAGTGQIDLRETV